jgi:hypothetical protein
VADPFPSDKLLDLYKIAIDEYRFEVRLGWDRTTYFLVLNSAILTVATGLLKLDNPPVVYGFIAVLYLFGCATSLVGSMSITKAHEYYRRTVVKKTLIENCLGLTNSLPDMHSSLNLATGTTKGQRDHLRILSNPEAWVHRRHARTAITFWLRWILRAMAVVDFAGSVTAMVMLLSQTPMPPSIH